MPADRAFAAAMRTCRGQCADMPMSARSGSPEASACVTHEGPGPQSRMMARPGDNAVVGYGALAQGTALETPPR